MKNSADVDLTKSTFIPEAPRVQRLTTTDGGHSEAVADSLAKEKSNGRLVGSPKKGSPSKKVKKTGKKAPPASATNKIRNEKALFTMNPKSITAEQIAKFVKSGNVEQLENAVLMGKGKFKDMYYSIT